jgi:hypothetical protein
MILGARIHSRGGIGMVFFSRRTSGTDMAVQSQVCLLSTPLRAQSTAARSNAPSDLAVVMAQRKARLTQNTVAALAPDATNTPAPGVSSATNPPARGVSGATNPPPPASTRGSAEPVSHHAMQAGSSRTVATTDTDNRDKSKKKNRKRT